jgi:hypothetical protein
LKRPHRAWPATSFATDCAASDTPPQRSASAQHGVDQLAGHRIASDHLAHSLCEATAADLAEANAERLRRMPDRVIKVRATGRIACVPLSFFCTTPRPLSWSSASQNVAVIVPSMALLWPARQGRSKMRPVLAGSVLCRASRVRSERFRPHLANKSLPRHSLRGQRDRYLIVV